MCIYILAKDLVKHKINLVRKAKNWYYLYKKKKINSQVTSKFIFDD